MVQSCDLTRVGFSAAGAAGFAVGALLLFLASADIMSCLLHALSGFSASDGTVAEEPSTVSASASDLKRS